MLVLAKLATYLILTPLTAALELGVIFHLKTEVVFSYDMIQMF